MNKHSIKSELILRQRGFNLVELMIAITIGFVIVGAIGYLFIGSRQSFRTTDAMSRIQENARYALQTMAHDVRMAGYVGCGSLQAVNVQTITAGAPLLTPANAIIGLDSGSGAATFGGITRPAGDAISVMGAFGGGVNITGTRVTNANVQITGNPYGFAAGNVLIASDCTHAGIFSATSVSNGTVPVTIPTATNVNTINWAGTYDTSAVVMKMEQYTYFIGTNPSGGRSLYRSTINDGTVELADNVWDMQVVYGYDTNGDGAADIYYTANAVPAWQNVVSARISLLMVSADNVLSGAQTYQYFSDAATARSAVTPAAAAVDRLRLHQVFTTTVGLRNRLP
jgi:type IV pilus assembly protein PilW